MSALIVAIGLSMDAFTLALSYGIYKVSTLKKLITSVSVGIFHFLMPLIGNFVGISLFSYTIIKPKIILFIVFLILGIDMIVHFFCDNEEHKNLSIIGILFFSFSVSFDSFSVGLGINYLYDNLFLTLITFSLVSASFTIIGFMLGDAISNKTGKYSFLVGAIILLLYGFKILMA